jgi:hypothetical protein
MWLLEIDALQIILLMQLRLKSDFLDVNNMGSIVSALKLGFLCIYEECHPLQQRDMPFGSVISCDKTLLIFVILSGPWAWIVLQIINNLKKCFFMQNWVLFWSKLQIWWMIIKLELFYSIFRLEFCNRCILVRFFWSKNFEHSSSNCGLCPWIVYILSRILYFVALQTFEF